MSATVSTDRVFRFGAMVEGNYLDLAYELVDCEGKLNQALAADTFATFPKQVYFIPILLANEEITIHEEEITYDPTAQKLFIQKIVRDYQQPLQVFSDTLAALAESEYPELLPLLHFVQQQWPQADGV